MATVDLIVHVTEDGRLEADVSGKLPPGDYPATVVLPDTPVNERFRRQAWAVRNIPKLSIEWPKDCSLEQEDFPGDPTEDGGIDRRRRESEALRQTYPWLTNLPLHRGGYIDPKYLSREYLYDDDLVDDQ